MFNILQLVSFPSTIKYFIPDEILLSLNILIRYFVPLKVLVIEKLFHSLGMQGSINKPSEVALTPIIQSTITF